MKTAILFRLLAALLVLLFFVDAVRGLLVWFSSPESYGFVLPIFLCCALLFYGTVLVSIVKNFLKK